MTPVSKICPKNSEMYGSEIPQTHSRCHTVFEMEESVLRKSAVNFLCYRKCLVKRKLRFKKPSPQQWTGGLFLLIMTEWKEMETGNHGPPNRKQVDIGEMAGHGLAGCTQQRNWW